MNKKTKQAMMENNTLEEDLTRENKDVMTDLICYLRSASLSDLEIEQVRKDIIYMLLDGQQHHQDAHAIIGEDYQSFCDEIIDTLPKQTKKQRLFQKLSTILMCVSILGTIELLFALLAYIPEPSLFPNLTLSFASLLNMILITWVAFQIVTIICVSSLQEQDNQGKRKIGIRIGFVLCFSIVSSLLFSSYTVTIPIALWIILLLFTFLGSKLLDHFSE